MARIPFGIPGLDQDFEGIPQGSFVLLTGEVDSGVDEFAYTSASMIQMANQNPELFRKYNDRQAEMGELPEKVRYISLERHEKLVTGKMDSVLNKEQYEALTGNMEFMDLTDEFFENMSLSLPTEGVENDRDYAELVTDLAQYLEEEASDDLVIIDSLTSLFKMTEFGLKRRDIVAFLTWLTDASVEWDGLFYAINHTRPTRVRDDAVLASTPDGIMYFSVSDIGGGFHRQMYMGSFRGTLSRSQNRIKVYDTSISSRGFEVSTVNEIM
jgi:KaiC/GvpD/RAD55 family RecA-like ATPase